MSSSSSRALDLGAVLGALQLTQLRSEAIHAAVQAPHLGVEAVDEAPQQALALVGELGPCRADTLCENPEGFADG